MTLVMNDDYAARILQKFGWKEGKGLGREQQGIAQPISICTQKTTEGVGYQSSLFEPWWNQLYDKVAINIKVKNVKKSKGEDKKSSSSSSSSKRSKSKFVDDDPLHFPLKVEKEKRDLQGIKENNHNPKRKRKRK